MSDETPDPQVPDTPPEFHATMPASEIIDQVAAEFRKVVDDITEAAPAVAQKQALTTARRWYLIAIIICPLLGAVATWAVLVWLLPRPTELTFKRGDTVEVCIKAPYYSPSHPVFLCTQQSDPDRPALGLPTDGPRSVPVATPDRSDR